MYLALVLAECPTRAPPLYAQLAVLLRCFCFYFPSLFYFSHFDGVYYYLRVSVVMN